MAWYKKHAARQTAPTADSPVAVPEHRPSPWCRWLRRSLIALSLLLATVAVGLFVALYWVSQTTNGHAWLLKTANAALEGKNNDLSLRLTRLEGTLPFNFVFGLEAADRHGVWLEAPENHLVWNWHTLPGSVRIEKVAILRPVLTRLPDLAPSPEPEEPSPPLTLPHVQTLLGKVTPLFRDPPFWLPEIFLTAIVENAHFPAMLLSQKGALPGSPAAAPLATAAQDDSTVAIPATGTEELRADAELTFSLLAESGVQVGTRAQLAGGRTQEMRLTALGLRQVEVTAAATVRGDTTTSGLTATAEMEIALEGPTLSVAGLPPDLLGSRATLRLALDATGLGDAYSAPTLTLHGPNLTAGRVSLQSEGSWRSGAGWSLGELDGPLALRLTAALTPGASATVMENADDPLAIFHAPLRFALTTDGMLPAPDLELHLDCAELVTGGHTLSGLALAVTGKELALPLGNAFPSAKETAIDLDVTASLNGHPLNTRGQFFYAATADVGHSEEVGALRAGVRDLRLHAAGVAGEGTLTALLSHGTPPALDGGLRLSVQDWAALSALVPGFDLTGDVTVELALNALAPAQESSDGARAVSQDIKLAWRIPHLTVKENGGRKVAHVQGLAGEAQLTDIFQQAALAARLNLAEARAAAMRLGAKFTVAGPLAGPLDAKLTSSGDVNSRVDVAWEPGQVLLRVFDTHANLPATMAGGKAARLGLRLERPARLHYGEAGIGVESLDLTLTPSGRLQARGGVAPDRLDLNVHLSGLELKPWSILVPALPSGTMELTANLNGSPTHPTGRFRLGVSGLRLSGSPLAPLTLALTGGIEPAGNGGILTTRLELPQASLKALGGDTARLAARVPLLFGPNGIPKPDMRGRFSAQVRWDGALGPLWSLVPMADRRLSGRIALNADASGTVEAPRIRGGVRVDQGRFEDLLLGALLTDITLRLNLDDRDGSTHGDLPGGMRLDLSASDGRGGKATITGSGALNGNDLNIRASIDRLRPLRRRDVRIMLSGKAMVTGSATAPNVTGEITVNQGEVLLNNISPGGSITTLPINTPPQSASPSGTTATAKAETGTPTAPATPQGKLDIRIIMLPRFTVEGRGLTSIWKANLLISGTPVTPEITGSVDAVRGNFDFLGKNFALTRGGITFAGGSLSDPLLDIDLTNEVPDLTAHIMVTGTVRKMKLTLTSEPSLPRDDILSRVLFGKSVNELGRLEALQLAGAVAQLAGLGSGSGGILDVTKKTLGVDVLRIGTSSTNAAGQPGDDSAGGTTLEMGKYLTDSIYMGVQQGMKSDNTAFIIQLELTPRTSMEVRTEQENTWGGLKWKYNY